MSDARYRRPRILSILLSFAVVASAIAQYITTVLVSAVSSPAHGARRMANAETLASSSLQWVVFSLAGTLLTMVWIRRANLNNAAFGRTIGISGPFLVVGFFIPVYGWWHRFRVIVQLWQGSARVAPEALDEDRAPWLARAWTATAVALSVVGMLTGVLNSAHGSTPMTVAITGIPVLVATLADAMVLVLIVKNINARQALIARRSERRGTMVSYLSHVPQAPRNRFPPSRLPHDRPAGEPRRE